MASSEPQQIPPTAYTTPSGRIYTKCLGKMPRKTTIKGAGGRRASERELRTDRSKASDVFDASDNANDDEEADDAQDEVLQMFAMLTEFQKRKSGKNSARSAAFEAKKDALFTEARKSAGSAVKEGIAYIEQYKTKVSEFRAREVSRDHHLKDLSLFGAREEAIEAVLAAFSPLFDDLSHRRAEAINETSAMLEAHAENRYQSRRRLIKHAKARIDEEQENQRIATDASALIKHYKALLLS